ncbi:MAG: hypothetical protein Q7K57_20585 [Burkholderiaceae bacterium]|nr:hypothetical protein [Burkholderiaceae bacterium]
MQINDFKSIVTTFADPGTELLFDKTQVVISVNGDLITAAIATKSGDVYVDEGSGQEPASKWIVNRLARLPLLAARLRESVVPTEFFVSPSASLLPTLERGPQGNPIATDDALKSTLQTINDRSPLETMVLYITSDAGEGKTSLINQLARAQTQLFTENKSDWLLVPIPLGGRHFLRFDDITVGALQNRYRFPFLYYNSFLALVKMGVIVPAFDGFEEMFVESSSGEALSAMGILVGSLESRGAMVVAARKAYFEFENLRTQERLFDTIRTLSVGFGKLELMRWAKPQFMAYCKNRGIANAEEIYRRVSERLTPDHALLTRAVLVKRLVDVATKSLSLDALLEQLQKSGTDFFSVFVRGLIEREANEKWIDRSGEKEVGAPLLSVEEHCEVLSHIALAMWEARVDYLKRDNLEFVADYFSESTRKNAFHAQQIRERIRGHAMLVSSANAAQAVEFDHDEFRLFFLGEGIARQVRPMNDRAKAEVLGTFRRGVLPRQSQHALILALTRDTKLDRLQVVKFLLDIGGMDAQASYTQENCSDIIIQILSGAHGGGLAVNGLVFGADALRDRKLSGITFHDCYFSPTSLELTELNGCSFVGGKFAQLRVFGSTRVTNVTFDRCTIDALVLTDNHRESWDPDEIRRQLEQLGVAFHEPAAPAAGSATAEEVAPEIRDMQKIVRHFMRSTHMNENIILMKLGVRGHGFIAHTLPPLMKRGVIVEIEYRGAGDQRRFSLGVSLQSLNTAIVAAQGSFARFLEQFGDVG